MTNEERQVRMDYMLSVFKAVSGKIFDMQDNELVYNDVRAHLMRKFRISVKDSESLLDDLFALGSYDKWPTLPLVKKAIELGAINEKITLPYPLTKKQLTIINRLLFHPEDEALFITTGVGGSGKSTFLNLIRQLFANDFSAASLSDLANDFSVAEAVKHRIICSDELAKGDLNCQILKTLASKQPLYVNPKHSVGYQVQTQSALFWCCNKAPKIDATDSGILRRIVYYYRNSPITNPDTSLNKKVFTEDELLTIARRALAYEDANWKDMFKKETQRRIMESNSVHICDSVTYSEYVDKCKAKGLKAFSEPNWLEIKELFDEWSSESQS